MLLVYIQLIFNFYEIVDATSLLTSGISFYKFIENYRSELCIATH